MQRLRRGKAGFSLIEVIIALGISLVVMGVLFLTYISMMKNSSRGTEILDFLRRSAILLESVKADVRSADIEQESLKGEGGNWTIRRLRDEDMVEVTYAYDEAKRTVTRTEGGSTRMYGDPSSRSELVANKGDITRFEIKRVEAMPGFFQVSVEFAVPTKQTRDAEQARARSPGGVDSKEESPYKFAVLVNKRGGETSDKTVKWNYVFTGADTR